MGYTDVSGLGLLKLTGETETMLGDVDENGTINILDVITLNKAVLGKESLSKQAEINADVDLNGTPDSTDSLTILKYIVGLVTSF